MPVLTLDLLCTAESPVKLPGVLQTYTPCPDLHETATTDIKTGGVTYMHDRCETGGVRRVV